MTQVKMFIHF